MKEQYDVVVVGGGPSGLSVARAVSSMNLSCIVIEKNKEIGIPVRTSGASWYSDIISLGINRKYLNPINKLSLISPGGIEATVQFEEPVACALDVTGAYKDLASQAFQHGAEFLLGAKVIDLITDHNIVRGVQVKKDGEIMYVYAKVTVDASGVWSKLTRKVGLNVNWSRIGVGAQYDLFIRELESNHSLLFVGNSIAPAGYGWFFPWSDNRARIGVGVIRPDSTSDPNKHLDQFLNHLQCAKRLADYTIKEKHFGVFPCAGPIKQTVANGFLSTGDAGGLGSPLFGEGIRYAIRFGDVAGRVIVKGIKKKNTSKKVLAEYQREWKRLEGRNFRLGLKIQKRLVHLDDKSWDKAVSFMKKIASKDPSLFIKLFRGEFKNRVLLRLFWKNPIRIPLSYLEML